MSDRRIGRYLLDVLVSQTGAVELWQGFDPALDRPVSLRLLPATDPRAAAAEAAARRAATVDDRRIIAVLDILSAEPLLGPEGAHGTFLVIVSEWVEGRTLTDIYEEREGEPIEMDEVVHVVRQVAIALKHSHELDVHHGRLRPGSLLVSETADFDDPFTLLGDTNVVRIRGLAVDAALWPDPGGPPPDAVAHDMSGVGSILYAMLTGRWPGGLVDGMSPAPRVGERLLPPSQVVADVPTAVDDICLRAIGPAVGGDDRIQQYADMGTVVGALTAWEQRPGRSAFTLASRDAGMSGGRRVARIAGRVLMAAAALVVVAGVGLAGLRLAQSADSPWGVNPDAPSLEVLTATGDAGAAGNPLGMPGEIVPVDATDFDPLGPDGEEMPDLVASAIDERSDTAWTTDTYYDADLDGKGGTGLVLDLGESQPVSAVRLELKGSGSSVKVLVAAKPYRKPSKWTLLAQAQSIGTAIDLRAPRPVVGRYVLIWFTQVPAIDGVYQGGIRDVTVLR